MTTIIESYAGKTVLGIGAHPDDLEIAMGGTLARLSRAGAKVVMTAVAIPDKLAERKSEAVRAARILGASFETLEPERCVRVEDLAMHDLVGRIDRLVRKYEPEALFSHSSHEIHFDHVLTHRAVLSSTRLRPMDVYLFGPSTCKPSLQGFQPRIWVDITDTVDAKIDAIAAHESQFAQRGICVGLFRDQARSRGLPLKIDFAEGLDIYCLRG